MKTVQDWIDGYIAGTGTKPRGVPEMNLGYGVESIERARQCPELWIEHTAHLTFIGMIEDGRIKSNVTLPTRQPVKRQSVTPDEKRHVKPLFAEMKAANICECCGKAFETARRHSKTCGKACRKRKSRGQCP